MLELAQPNSAPDKELEEKKEVDSDEEGRMDTMGQTQSNFGTTMHDFNAQSPDTVKSKSSKLQSDEKDNNGLPSENINDNEEDLV